MSPANGALDRILEGAVDMHCHSGPSPFPRRMDHVEAARMAESVGMRAIVVKSHHHPTVMDLRAMAPRLDGLKTKVYGSIALNSQVGGLNPSAVDLALKMGGKVVWFPTISARRHIEHQQAHPDLKFPKPSVPLRKPEIVDILDERGDLRPEVPVILGMIAEADAVLAAGHQAPDRIQILLAAAAKAGVKRIIVNHPEYVIAATREQVVKFADSGALIEHECCMYDERSEFYHWDLAALKSWVDLVGADRTSIASDLGQVNNPLPIEAFKKLLSGLHDLGVNERDLGKMVRDNPARLLGLN
ncbi:MAG TPA: DUF6282 family protein [Candidatus Limnocylindria bacterium]|jgi:hypothetical protein|nr:DUF6282 family protein [Candidatus Limnocylindria bacterium]